MSHQHNLAQYLSRPASGATPHQPQPAGPAPLSAPLRDPIGTALAQAREAADQAQQAWQRGDHFDDDVEPLINLAHMWADVARAEADDRMCREVRYLSDAVLRLARELAPEVDQ